MLKQFLLHFAKICLKFIVVPSCTSTTLLHFRAHKVRAFDCARNQERYPVVDYEEMYVLDGGYNAFYGFAKNLVIFF